MLLALAWTQQDRALPRLGPQQNHLARRRQQHMHLAVLEIGVDE